MTESGRAALVIHSWWGLTPGVRAYADQLADRGFVAGCADLYDGEIATTEVEVRALRSARRRLPMYKTLLSDIDALLGLDSSEGPHAGVVGLSMGGHWAAWLAQRSDVPIGATVLYYAARGGDYAPATSPVVAHFAADDPYVSAQARRTMERAIARTSRDYVSYDYAEAHHGFAEIDQPTYDGKAAEVALDRTVAFLDDSLP